MEDHERTNGFDRRRFIKGAATVAWATPLILTLGASSASAQLPAVSPGQCLGLTNRPEGCPCTASGQCVDGCCCSAPNGPAGGCTSPDNCDTLNGTCAA